MTEVRQASRTGTGRRDADPTATLRRAIETGHFLPGQRLTEMELAEWLGTNRANVRLALGKLEQEGLIVNERNRGARVRVISEEEAVEILEARAVLEAMVARQAARRATVADRRVLGEILEALHGAEIAAAFEDYSRQSARLHAEIHRIAAHSTGARLLSMLNAQIVRFQLRTMLFPGRMQESIREHADIVEAIRAGDEDQAGRAMQVHFANAARTLERSLSAARAYGF